MKGVAAETMYGDDWKSEGGRGGAGGEGVVQARHREGYYLAETNTYHENIPNSKTACVRTERQQVGTK